MPTPDDLFDAVRRKDIIAVYQLLNAHPDWALLKDESLKTPLHYACNTTFLKAVIYLVKLGASFTAQDHDGNTPLHFAFGSYRLAGNLEMVDMPIIKWMALMDIPFHAIKNNAGQSPLRFTSEKDAEKARRLYRILGHFSMAQRMELIGEGVEPLALPPWLQGLATYCDESMRRLYDTQRVEYRGRRCFICDNENGHYKFSPRSLDLVYPDSTPQELIRPAPVSAPVPVAEPMGGSFLDSEKEVKFERTRGATSFFQPSSSDSGLFLPEKEEKEDTSMVKKS